MVIKQVSNKPCDKVLETWQFKLKLLKSKFRIEIHVYTNEWVTLTNELLSLNSQTESFECIPGLATKLLVMVSRHVISLALNWFPGMLACSSQAEDKPPTYMPCWKCYSEIGTANLLDKGTVGVKYKFPFTICLRTVHCLKGSSFSCVFSVHTTDKLNMCSVISTS